MSRREQVLALLRWYKDATCTLQRGDTGGRFVPESRALQMPAIYWRGSFRALERCLDELRRIDKAAFVGVWDRYIDFERRQRLVRKAGERPARNERLLARGHRPARTPQGIRYSQEWIWVECWRSDADLQAAERGLEFLVRRMPGVIRVPEGLTS